MLKKTLISFLLFGTLLLHADIVINATAPNENGAITLEIPPGSHHLIQQKDWVGVYKKGATNAWKNVIIWKWVKSFDSRRGDYTVYNDILQMKKAGEYQVRYFKNNSYTVYKAFDFTIKGNVSPVSQLYYDDYLDRIAIVGFTKNVTKPAPKDWIGIYPVGSNNNWGNVIEWRWAKDSSESGNQQVFEKDKRYIFLDKGLYAENVKYEARYFLNNSFVTHKKSNPFTLAVQPINLFRMTAFPEANYVSVYLVGLDGYLQPNPKDWIGIYKKGTSTNWGNVLAWIWAKDVDIKVVEQHPVTKYSSLKVKLSKGDYEVRYFLNNSFTTYKSSSFTVK